MNRYVLIIADSMAVGPFRTRKGAEAYAKIHQHKAFRVLLISVPFAGNQQPETD